MTDERAIEQLEEFLVIDDWSAVYMPYLQDAIEYVINRIKEDKWIPVRERLPEKFDDVIVRDIETTRTYSGYYIGNGVWSCDNGDHKDRITHWRPFPEYKEGEDN